MFGHSPFSHAQNLHKQKRLTNNAYNALYETGWQLAAGSWLQTLFAISISGIMWYLDCL